MKTLDLIQGSEEWQAARAKYFTASEAPAMLGLSKYQTRQDLLRQKATGHIPEVDSAKQRLFDRGHAAESAARPIVEEIIGDELFPSTGVLEVEGLPLLASFDGITMDETIVWENKLSNASLIDDLTAGELDGHYWSQLEQQLLVSGAEKAYFTASDGTPENTLGMWYKSVPKRRQQLIAGWKQFAEDLANYQHVEVIQAVVAAPTEGFGALVLQVEGRVVACNIDAFRAGASAFLSRLPKPEELNSDKDFANAESAVKACTEAESKIKAAKDAGLAQMSEVDTVFRVADQIVAEIKAARLSLEKSVELRKTSIRGEIVQSGKDRFADHIYALNKRLGRVMMPLVPADFVGAIKGKRTVVSLQNAVDTVLANSKIAANEIADKIQANLATLDENKEHAFLFNDLASLAMKAPDDLQNIIKLRISEHQAEQQRKLEAEREKIRREEQAKAEREQQEKAAAEKREAEQKAQTAERERLVAERAAQKELEAKAEQEKQQEPAKEPEPITFVHSAPATQSALSFKTQSFIKYLDDEQFNEAEIDLLQHYAERLVSKRNQETA